MKVEDPGPYFEERESFLSQQLKSIEHLLSVRLCSTHFMYPGMDPI